MSGGYFDRSTYAIREIADTSPYPFGVDFVLFCNLFSSIILGNIKLIIRSNGLVWLCFQINSMSVLRMNDILGLRREVRSLSFFTNL